MIGSMSATVASRAGGLGAQLPGGVRLGGLLSDGHVAEDHVAGQAPARLAERSAARLRARLVRLPVDGHDGSPAVRSLRSISASITRDASARVRSKLDSNSGRPRIFAVMPRRV